MSPTGRLLRWTSARALPGMLDAGVSSVGNIVVTAVAANLLPLAELGAFVTAFFVSLIAVGVSRAVHTDPLVLGHSSAPGWQAPSRSALGSVTTAGAVVAGLTLLVVLPVGAATGWDGASSVVLATGLMVPLLLLQDAYRWVDHARGRPWSALANNAAWTASLLVLLTVLAVADTVRLEAWSFVLVWAGTSVVGVLAGVVTTRLLPSLRTSLAWYRDNAGTSTRLLVDFALIQVTAEAAFLLVAAVAGPTELALLRKAQLPLGPVTILTTGIVVVMQPWLSGAQHRGAGDGLSRRATLGVCGAVAALACGVGVGVYLLPQDLMDLLVGGGWADVRHLVVPLTGYVAAGAVAAYLGVGLRAAGRLPEQVRLRLWLSPLLLAATAAGAHLGGATAAAWALFGGVLVLTLLWAYLLLVRHPVAVAGEPEPERERADA